MLARRPQQRPRVGLLSEINIVPYIDVMLVLLVIFMITAPLLTQGINVKLPHAAAKALSPDKELPIVVSVDHDGAYYLNLAATPLQAIPQEELLYRVAALVAVAKEAGQVRPVYVKGDNNVSYGKVVALMALLQRAGAGEVGLITDPGAESNKAGF